MLSCPPLCRYRPTPAIARTAGPPSDYGRACSPSAARRQLHGLTVVWSRRTRAGAIAAPRREPEARPRRLHLTARRSSVAMAAGQHRAAPIASGRRSSASMPTPRCRLLRRRHRLADSAMSFPSSRLAAAAFTSPAAPPTGLAWVLQQARNLAWKLHEAAPSARFPLRHHQFDKREARPPSLRKSRSASVGARAAACL